jgi:hypothetical protein
MNLKKGGGFKITLEVVTNKINQCKWVEELVYKPNFIPIRRLLVASHSPPPHSLVTWLPVCENIIIIIKYKCFIRKIV